MGTFSGGQKYTHTFENEMNDRGLFEKKEVVQLSSTVRSALRAWYLVHARDLPWRTQPSLYGTWLSEVMLQQTRMETGIPKWHLFMDLFPTVSDLAQASEDDVLKAWEGLGYYRRARLLHRAAQTIASLGAFPQDHQAWLDLPGIGPYTAAAIASIGLNQPVAAVDGNVQRVVSRWAGIEWPVDSSRGKRAVEDWAEAWLDHEKPGDHNQAVMELGALICTPKAPQCSDCPISSTCASRDNPDLWSRLPSKKPKRKPSEWVLNLHVVQFEGRVVMLQRPQEGIWAKLWLFPENTPPSDFQASGQISPSIKHLLTHRIILASLQGWHAPSWPALQTYAESVGGAVLSLEECLDRAKPSLLTKHWDAISSFLGSDKS